MEAISEPVDDLPDEPLLLDQPIDDDTQESIMTDTKSILTSKGVLGGAVALAAIVAGFFGFKIDAGLQSAIGGSLNDLIAAVAAVVAIYGRVVATKRIG